MMHRRLNLNRIRRHRLLSGLRVIVLGLGIVLAMVAYGFGDAIDGTVARLVAQNQVNHHVALFGHWNGVLAPTANEPQPVLLDGSGLVAYHVPVDPSGYVLVAPDDALSPIPFYSTRSEFNPDRFTDGTALESWIVPEMRDRVGALARARSQAAQRRGAAAPSGSPRTRALWDHFKQWTPERPLPARASKGASMSGGLTPADARSAVSPLLTTAWDQDSPYNVKLPDDDCPSGHVVAGCVATAWAQVLNYYEWPEQGTGTLDHVWDGTTYSVDFSDTKAYDWDNMPDVLDDSASSPGQKDAVGWLMYYTGIAAETEFGCTTSSSTVWASDVFDTYFKYKDTIELLSRFDDSASPPTANYDADAWFDLMKAELDQGRVVIFSIFSDSGGHEVVVDGYNDTDAVHINYGWDGNYDGYYNVSDDSDFNTGPFNWYVDRQQYIVVGIAPDRPATSSPGGGGGGGGCIIATLLSEF